MTKLTFDAWKALVRGKYPEVKFTLETGAGETYGEKGDWVAHTGPDMQADVVGVYALNEFCTVFDNTTSEETYFDVS